MNRIEDPLPVVGFVSASPAVASPAVAPASGPLTGA